MTQPKKLALVLLLGCCTLSSCTQLGIKQLGVKPWERDLLAQKAMQPNGAPLENAADEHTYFSKEAATGGAGFGGGGCGCN